MGRIKTLLHVHTNYSFDSNTSPEALLRAAKDAGVGCIGVTDHDSIEGARQVASIADIPIIIGEEVSTRDGHLIGLFLDEWIRPGMSARETALAIRGQGGLVFAPHPYLRFGGCGLRGALETIVDLIDAVEVCNGQDLFSGAGRQAQRFADRHRLTTYVGSDSHVAESLAPCYQWQRPFQGAADFLDSLSGAELYAGRHPASYFVSAAWRTVRYALTGAAGDGFGANHVPEEAVPASVAC